MKLAIACDHAGFDLKEEVKKLLEQQGHEVIDFGTTSTAACDLPDTVYPAALAVARGQADGRAGDAGRTQEVAPGEGPGLR